MEDLTIQGVEMYKDGGTIEITTNKGIFCFDDRLGSKTKGRLYDGYPKDDNSNIINDSKDLKSMIIEKLKNHKDDFYQSSIDHFIKINNGILTTKLGKLG